MQQASLIEFKHAFLGYGKRVVLKDVGFAIEPGSFWGILGHNGSGKTTILKTLLGLIPCLKGQVLEREAPAALHFGYVPQKERLDPIYPLSAFDVAALGSYRRLELFPKLRGLDHSALVRHCLRECGALELADRRYGDLSGGQKQRVLIARALAAEPAILALDEPLAGIDITTQQSLLKLLKRLKEELHLTILMVSHRVRAEKDLFSHIAWVDEGVVTTGPAGEMLATKISEVFKTEL